jgi:hypothetical protein
MKATIVYSRFTKATFVPAGYSKATFIYRRDTKATFMNAPRALRRERRPGF